MAQARKHFQSFDAWGARHSAIDELCEAVCATADATLSAWCTGKQFRHSMVRDWINQDEQRAAKFELANRKRAHLIADYIGTLARQPIPDALAIEHRRLQIETLQWICAQLNPQYRMHDAG